MTTDDSKNTALVAWEEELAKSANEVAALETPKLANFSFRAGVLAFNGVALPGNKLECIVVASAFIHRLYEGAFDADNPQSPICFALSLSGEDMAPHEDSVQPQSEKCETCENFKWGSAEKGRGKACKAGRRLILIPRTALINGIGKAEMGMATLPVTSVRGWGNYVNALATQYRRPPWAMLTEMSVVPDVKTQFQVKFQPLGMVDNEHLAELRAKIEMANAVLLAPYEFSENAEKKDDGKPKKERKF
jgi:hypothetical protein